MVGTVPLPLGVPPHANLTAVVQTSVPQTCYDGVWSSAVSRVLVRAPDEEGCQKDYLHTVKGEWVMSGWV